MGLDMYLTARRTFAPESAEADELCVAAGVTLDHLVGMAKRAADDPYEEATMYLSRWNHERDTDEYRRAWDVVRLAEMEELTTPDSGGGAIGVVDGQLVVETTCAYWRKANAIHGWFVDRCQNGVDECQLTPVHVEQLAHLRAECIAVLMGKKEGEEVLPTREGFFFGRYDTSDPYYQECLKDTVRQIENVIHVAVNLKNVEIFYQSSW